MTTDPEILALRAMPLDELVAEYTRLWGRPPRVRNRAHLWRRCALKRLEAKHGGLSRKANERLEQLISEIDFPAAELPEPQPRTLVRHHGGRDHVVTVQPDGSVEYQGEVYASLSAVAFKITGSRWSGPLFFGLKKRKR